MEKRSGHGPVVAFFDVDGTLVYRTKESGPGTCARPAVAEAVRTGRYFRAIDGTIDVWFDRGLCPDSVSWLWGLRTFLVPTRHIPARGGARSG